MYHQGTGLSVDDQYLTAYRGIAGVLLQNLFNENAESHPTEKISLETLILNWNKIEQKAKKEIEKRGFSTSYKWEEKFIHSYISEETAKKISDLRKARNRLVHSTKINYEDIKDWTDKSNQILREFEQNQEFFAPEAINEEKIKNPVCFISYAWESEQHSTWVRELAEYLQRNGVNTILDQWDLRPGMDMAHFMEKSISTSDYVLLICTPLFSQKANEGIGGVGYEKNIVTSEILKKIKPDTNIVPILRIGDDKNSIPTYLGSKNYLDFRQNDKFEKNIKNLLRHIYNIPKFKRPKPEETPKFNNEVDKEKKINSFSIGDIEEAALSWKEQNFPYFIVEGLQEVQKAYVRHPPNNTKIENPITLSFLLLAGFHYGGNWCFWLNKNSDNELITKTFESSFSVSYNGPLYRSLFALQFMSNDQIIDYILKSSNINESVKMLIKTYVVPDNIIEYLTKLSNEDTGKAGQRASVVMKEINQYCSPK